ncbi:MAG: outer membrane protein transport protein, partial [Planctomycetes bacterium]|nr:outer membrane protein transport protein [Planctomycetota bacterium]
MTTPLGCGFRRHPAAASAVLLVVALPRALASNGVELTGISFQARARGGADVAVGDSALSQIDNPATLTLTRHGRPRFDFTGQFVFPDVSWSNPLGSYQSEIQVVPIGDAAVAFPVNERFTWGLAVHGKSGLATRYHARHLLIPFQQRRVESDCKNLGFYLSGGYRLTDKLSVGGGIRGELLTAEFSAVLGPADVEFGRGYAYGLGFQLGMHYQATDTLAFGIAYRSPTWANDLRGGQARAALFGVLPIPLGDANIDTVRLPQRVAAGAAWDVTDWCKLVGEVRWLNYSNSIWNNLTVATDGVVDLRVPLPLGYRDQWVFITGAELKLDQHWTLGVGYNYGRTPATGKHLFPVGTVLAEHHAT